MRLLTTLSQYLDRISFCLGKSLCWLSALMALLVTFLVVLRSSLDWGSIAAQEVLTYMHATSFMLLMAYTYQQKGHVRVDIFYRRLSPLAKAWVDCLGIVLFLLPFSLFIVFSSWAYVAQSWAIGESSSNPGGLPGLYLLKSLIPLSGVLLFIQGLADLIKHLLFISFEDITKVEGQQDA